MRRDRRVLGAAGAVVVLGALLGVSRLSFADTSAPPRPASGAGKQVNGLTITTDTCVDSKLEGHDGFQKGDRCVSTEFGEVGSAARNPTLLITKAPRFVRAGEPFQLQVSTRNLVRDRFLAAGKGGYYVESSVLTAQGLVRGHFHTACRMLSSTREAVDPSPVPAFFVATEDGKGGSEPDTVTIQVPGMPDAGDAQCASWAGDGSHRIPMMERANQTPAFDTVRIRVGRGTGQPPAGGQPPASPPVSPPASPPVSPPVSPPGGGQPPTTQAPGTKPPATQAPGTKPPVTQAPGTKPPAAQDPGKEPGTQAPATQAPATRPPATEPPVRKPTAKPTTTRKPSGSGSGSGSSSESGSSSDSGSGADSESGADAESGAGSGSEADSSGREENGSAESVPGRPRKPAKPRSETSERKADDSSAADDYSTGEADAGSLVSDAGDGTPDRTAEPPPAAADKSRLALTGANTIKVVGGGLILLASGLLAMWVTRRRPRRSSWR